MANAWSTAFSRIHDSNFDTARAEFRRLYGESAVDIEGDFEWNADVASMGPVTLVQGALDTFAHLNVTMQRHALIVSQSTSIHVRAPAGITDTIPHARAAMLSPGVRTTLTVEPGMLSRNLLLDPAFLESQFAALTGEPARNAIEFELDLRLNGAFGTLIEQVCYYVAEKIGKNTQSMPPALSATLCESLSRTLLFHHPHNQSYLFEKPAPPSSRTIVRMVEEYIDAHAGGPIVASDLARITGTSVKSIDAAFVQHRQTSPLAFLRQRRIERARRLLLENPMSSTMDVARLAGYLRIEPFEAAYFKQFGESPAQTRQRGRVGKTSRPLVEIAPNPRDRIGSLSEREREVCTLVAQGNLNKQIADALGITERTVKEHRGRAMKKLGVESTAELARLWERLGK